MGGDIAWCPVSFQKSNFGNSSQKTQKGRYQTFLFLSHFTGFVYFVPNILPRIVGILLKFYTRVAKGLKLKVRKFWGLIPMFAEVTGEKLVEEGYPSPHPK